MNTTEAGAQGTQNKMFIQEWTPEQHKQMDNAIFDYFRNRKIYTHHNPEGIVLHTPKAIDNCMGLAYTSSSSMAGLWICNMEVESNHEGFKYVGFIMSKIGTPCALLWDKNENEKYIRLSDGRELVYDNI